MSKVLPSGETASLPGDGRRKPMTFARGVLRTSRPKQWVKNILVFAAPGAAGVLTHERPLIRATLTFAVFCVVAAGTYFLNDSLDVEADRRHPVKCRRPIAAGVISVRQGLAFGAGLLALGLAGSFIIDWRLGVVMGVYVALQFAYSLYLKHQPVYDLASVAAGFVLRAIAGGVAANVAVSEWFLIVATFGSLLMVTGKRLAEHAELGDARGEHRATLDAYSATFLRTVVAISAGAAIVGYCLWAFNLQTAMLHHHDPIWYQLSIVPIVLALLRYTYLVEDGRGAKPEELILGDHSMQLLGIVWVALFALGVYAS